MTNYRNSFSKEIYISDIFRSLKSNFFKIISCTILVSIATVVVVLNMPNIYKSKAVLAQNSTFNNVSNLSRYSELASLAGVNMQSGGGENNGAVALELLMSLNFFESLAKQYNILVPLLASKNWDSKNNKLNIDNNVYDQDKKVWNSKSSFLVGNQPSLQVAHKLFLESIFINVNKETGFIELSVEHISPIVARDWVKNIVDHLNYIISEEKKVKSDESIKYLKNELKITSTKEIRESISLLITKEIEKLMLINSSPEYVFNYIAYPYIPEKKIKPTRSTICIISSLLAFFLSSLIFLIRDFYK